MSYIKKTRKVSIIMGVYNCASTLSEAIESLLAQTFKDWELIMCDDGSTDSTMAVAQSYVDKYDNILLIRNEQNMGLPTTLNHCLEYAESEYIARMDGDDISLPERFEIEVGVLDKYPEYAIVSGGMICFDETGEWGVVKTKEKPQKMDFVYDTPFCHAPCMVRREALNKVGNYTVNERLRRGQDYYLWYKFYKNGYVGYNIQKPIYKMRDDRNAAKRRTFKSAFLAFSIQKEIFDGLGIPKIYYYRLFRGVIVTLIPKQFYIFLHKMKNR